MQQVKAVQPQGKQSMRGNASFTQSYQENQQSQQEEKKRDNEEITRVLSTVNPNAPQNTQRYSYAIKAFRNDPSCGQTHFHFSSDGCFDYTDPNNYNPTKKTDEQVLYNQFNFSSRGTQTFNVQPKSIKVETQKMDVTESSGAFSRSIIYDCYKTKQIAEKKQTTQSNNYQQQQQDITKFQNKEGLVQKDSASNINKDNDQQKSSALLSLSPEQLEQVKKSLQLAERLVTEKSCNEIIKDFANWDDPADQYQPQKGSLYPLWDFVPQGTSKPVAAIEWHPKYRDIFAVAYGKRAVSSTINQQSQINIYSLKNVYHPEKTLVTDCDVICLAWNSMNDNLLLAGLIDGNINLFDISTCKLIAKSSTETGKHLDLVSNVGWMNEHDKELQMVQFISVSHDGCIIQWSFQLGQLKQLSKITVYDTGVTNDIGPVVEEKHELNNFQKQLQDAVKNTKSQLANDATILIDYRRDKQQTNSNHPLVGINCLKFSPDPECNWMYAFGCDNGLVRLSSTAYAQDFHQSFTQGNSGHQAVVHQISFNKFQPDMIASASEDNFLKIWQVKNQKPLYSYDLQAPVIATSFSSAVSTTLVAATAANKIHIFDFAVNKEKELCIQQVVPDDTRLTCFNQSKAYPILAVGDSSGIIRMFKMSPNLHNKAVFVPQAKIKGQVQQITQEEIKKIELEMEQKKINDYVNWCKKASLANGEQ